MNSDADNRLIAELARRCMGWQVFYSWDELEKCTDEVSFFLSDTAPLRCMRHLVSMLPDRYEYHGYEWDPLESIAAAWMLLDRASDYQAMTTSIHPDTNRPDLHRWEVWFGERSERRDFTADYGIATASTPQRAICLAIADALGIEVTDG